MIHHATASAFVFARLDDVWHLDLILHPRLHLMMIPGGHVEHDEDPVQAAIREAAEETGHDVTLIAGNVNPGPLLPPTHRRVAVPWWITTVDVGPDSVVDEPHVHVDHQYVAVVTGEPTTPLRRPEHPWAWFPVEALPRESMCPDTVLLADYLFQIIGGIA